jgi:hypothetical protein
MLDTELDRMEALFRNPPSASGMAHMGLELCAEVRRLRTLHVSLARVIRPEPIGESVEPASQPEPAPEPEMELTPVPTPPTRAFKKRSK